MLYGIGHVIVYKLYYLKLFKVFKYFNNAPKILQYLTYYYDQQSTIIFGLHIGN